MKEFVVVIPARYDSTRFPGKPLEKIKGKEMLLRTFEQVNKVVNHDNIFIATDSPKIEEFCNKNNINSVMTSSDCLTGTDRIAEFSKKIDAEYYVNVQGDEPVFNPEDLIKLLWEIKIEKASGFNRVLNGYTPIDNLEDFESRSTPKVVFDRDKKLLYMSRSPIPGSKNKPEFFGYRQVCLYAFPKKELGNFYRTSKTEFEEIEDIEILRFVENKVHVRMIEMSNLSQPVDNPEDIAKVEKVIEERNL